MATQASELDQDAFMELVTENHLQVEGPTKDHWLYTGRRGKNGWELYKTRTPPVGWLYQARRVCTQNAVGGGAMTVRVQCPAGVTMRLVKYLAIGSASAGAAMTVGSMDEDNAVVGRFAAVAAAANIATFLPALGGAATSTNNTNATLEMMFGPGEVIYATTSAALQTETLTIAVEFLMSASQEPTWDTTGSAGTPVLAASTISAANTLQAVYL